MAENTWVTGVITLLIALSLHLYLVGAQFLNVFNRPLTFQFLRTNRNHGFLLIIISSLVQYVHHYIGDGHPTFDRNPYNWYIKPYYWVDEFIPYYMEIMGVDRPIAHMNLKPGGIFRTAMLSLQEGIRLQMSRRV